MVGCKSFTKKLPLLDYEINIGCFALIVVRVVTVGTVLTVVTEIKVVTVVTVVTSNQIVTKLKNSKCDQNFSF